MKAFDLQWVMRTVQRQMMAVARAEFMAVESELWAALDSAITLRECEIYSYNPGKFPYFHHPLPVNCGMKISHLISFSGLLCRARKCLL